ncbi:hypothetical protein HanHA300_Chr05g0177101 [Helianthus annuus]|nr:hypothetical protein HanHA300_Chr05g0177101 [Helianthus annuus]
MLPGWHVEEFMDTNVSHPYGMFEGYEGGACTLPFMAQFVGLWLLDKVSFLSTIFWFDKYLYCFKHSKFNGISIR